MARRGRKLALDDTVGKHLTDYQETDRIERRSTGHMRRGGAWTANTDTLPWRGAAAGGYSTAGDLLRFAHALETGKLLSKSMLAQAATVLKERYRYGFGIDGEGALRSSSSA